MARRKKRILAIVGLIIFTCAAAGYMIWNEPQRDIQEANGITTTAIILYKQLTTDSQYNKALLVNKVLIVSGKVKQVESNQKGEKIILLETNFPGASVNCTMEEKIKKKINTGDSIAIKGICSGYIAGDVQMDLPGDVYMIRCYLSNEK